jgi:hypothetical protein
LSKYLEDGQPIVDPFIDELSDEDQQGALYLVLMFLLIGKVLLLTLLFIGFSSKSFYKSYTCRDLMASYRCNKTKGWL